MAKLSLLVAALLSATVAVSSTRTEDFIRSIEPKAYHDDSAHGDRFLLCEDMPGVNTLEMTFFGLTNAEAFKNGANAVVREYSPLQLKHIRQKTKCSVNVDDFGINVNMVNGWTYMGGDLNQKISTVNIPFVRMGRSLCTSADTNGECLEDLVTMGEGYLLEDVSLSEMLNGVNIENYSNFITSTGISGKFPELQKSRFSVLNEIHSNFPKKISMNSDSDKFGDITAINEESELVWWKSDASDPLCYRLAGTNGDIFNGRITQQSVLHYYSEDLCGLAILQFDSIDTSYGFDAYKFVMHTSSVSSMCYCPYGNCFPSGVVDVHACQGGLPLVMSLPHFFEGDVSFRSGVTGMSPAANNHQTYFIIEPTTGMVIKSSQKLQVNVNLKTFASQGNHWEGKDLQNTVVPLYWFDKTYELDETHINAVRQMLTNPSTSTTTETPTDAPSVGSDVDMKTVGDKLNDIAGQLRTVSTFVITFTVLIVVFFVAFGIKSYYQSRLRAVQRSHVLPPPAYQTK